MFNLQLAIGVRPLNASEYPEGYDVEKINKSRDAANITPGYKLHKGASGEKYTHYFEINIDNQRLWSLFSTLSNIIIPEFSYGVISHFRHEKAALSDVVQKKTILALFQRFEFELVNDGFLGFGIAHYDETSLNEIFVQDCKYLKVWTSKSEELLKTLHEFGLKETPNMKFIDEFPVIRESISITSYPESFSNEFIFKFISTEFQQSFHKEKKP